MNPHPQRVPTQEWPEKSVELAQLLAHAGLGDRRAFAQLYERTSGHLLAGVGDSSLDLSGFASAVSGTTFVLPATWSPTPPAGHSYHSFKLDASSGLTGKGFMRLNATQP